MKSGNLFARFFLFLILSFLAIVGLASPRAEAQQATVAVTIPEDDISEINVLLTIVDGKVVYEGPDTL